MPILHYMDVQALNVELRGDLYWWLRAKAVADARTLKATLELIILAAQAAEAAREEAVQ